MADVVDPKRPGSATVAALVDHNDVVFVDVTAGAPKERARIKLCAFGAIDLPSPGAVRASR